VIIMSFSYVFVITKASQIFNCARSEPQFLLSDTKYICWQGEWWQYFPFALITLGGFGGGILVLFIWIACNRKKVLTSRTFNARFRFLFIGFRDERIYWEVIIILRKLAISCAVIFFSGGRSEMLVVLFAMLIIFIAFILQTHNYPFRRRFHNIMEYCVLLSTEFLLFCALLFFVDEFPDDWNKPALGWLCIITVCGSSVLIAFLMLCDFIAQWREDRLQQAKELELLKNRPEESQDPLSKFKEKRRQATAIVELHEEKEKEEGVTQQQVEVGGLVKENTGRPETHVDLGQEGHPQEDTPHVDTHPHEEPYNPRHDEPEVPYEPTLVQMDEGLEGVRPGHGDSLLGEMGHDGTQDTSDDHHKGLVEPHGTEHQHDEEEPHRIPVQNQDEVVPDVPVTTEDQNVVVGHQRNQIAEVPDEYYE